MGAITTRSIDLAGSCTNSNNNGTGTPVNEIQYAYNAANLVSRIYQAHSGAVNPSTSPFVEFTYATTQYRTSTPTASG